MNWVRVCARETATLMGSWQCQFGTSTSALHCTLLTLWLPSLHILRCPAGHAGTSAACYQACSLGAPARHLPLPSARAL